MFFCRVKKDLVVLMAGEDTPPNEQNYEYGSSDPPGDQKVQNGPVWCVFHGDLPLEPFRGAGPD
jgi:hypothetical protein